MPDKRELWVLFSATLVIAVALTALAVGRNEPALVAIATGAVVASGYALIAG